MSKTCCDDAIIDTEKRVNFNWVTTPSCHFTTTHAKYALALASGQFQDTLSLVNNTDGKTVKRELAHFIGKYKGESIDQIFFYYSGHGDSQGEDVQFLLTDFQEIRGKQTSLSNEEVDILLRSLQPQVTVKVVDACHAGVAYIKDRSILQKAVAATESRFKNCYFMFSCRKDQVSFQKADHLSDFTASFADAVKEHAGSSIRYQDIADFIADDFAGNPDQTPYFVSQASLTEVFCDVTAGMAASIDAIITKTSIAGAGGSMTVSGDHSPTLIDIVKKDAERYCTEDEAGEALSTVSQTAKQHTFGAEINNLFDVAVEDYSDVGEVPERMSIAKWLDENKHDYFVKVDHRKQKLVGWELSLPRLPGLDYEYVASDFSLTVEADTVGVEVTFKPKYQNLDQWELNLVVVFSKVALRFFHAFRKFKDTNWEVRQSVSRLEWKTGEVPLKDLSAIRTFIDDTLANFEKEVLVDVTNKLVPKSEVATGDKADGTS